MISVLIMFPKWFWSIIVSVGIASVLFSREIRIFTQNYSLCSDFSLQNQSFLIDSKRFLELDNDVLNVFPKWFWSVMLSVRTVSDLVFSRNLNFYPELYIGLVLIFSLQNQLFLIRPKLFIWWATKKEKITTVVLSTGE